MEWNDTPFLPKDEDGPVFAEPWQAQVFALAIKLCDEGHFTWGQWVEEFSIEINRAQAAGDPDLGDTYYNHWLNTLERIISTNDVLSISEISTRKEEWRQAFLHTPHGKPVELK